MRMNTYGCPTIFTTFHEFNRQFAVCRIAAHTQHAGHPCCTGSFNDGITAGINQLRPPFARGALADTQSGRLDMAVAIKEFYCHSYASLGASCLGNRVPFSGRRMPSANTLLILAAVSGMNGSNKSAISIKQLAWYASTSRKWSASPVLATAQGFSSSMYWFKPRT